MRFKPLNAVAGKSAFLPDRRSSEAGMEVEAGVGVVERTEQTSNDTLGTLEKDGV